ncbi:MAG: ABC transporter permease [Desulfobacteraceae bacterium]|nr:MAG: ABC transporter permease [Desulfobacteraceae bacterium]
MMFRLRSAQASLRHIRAVTRKEIHHIVRDRSTLCLVLFTPTLVLLLMGYALTVDLKHIPIAVLDLDRTQTSQAFIQQITAGEDLDLYTCAASMEEIDAMLMRGKIKAGVIIAPGFASDLQAMKGIPLQLIIDGTEPESGQYAVEHISQRVEEFINSALTVQLRAQGIPITSLQIIDLRIQTWYNPDLKPRNALIPGLISMVLGFPALSVALTLAHEREHGTLEQLLATPIGRAELLIGKTLPYILVGLINVILIPMFSIAWFHVSLNGSFLLFFLLSAIFMFEVLGMGLIIGVFMRTQAAALALSFLVLFFPGFFLTGIFFPLVSMPEEVRMQAMFLPGTHYAIITRGIFLPGVGIEVLWPYAVMMVILGVSFTALASLFFRKRLS